MRGTPKALGTQASLLVSEPDMYTQLPLFGCVIHAPRALESLWKSWEIFPHLGGGMSFQ